jgi:hypothetical protein
MTNKKVDLRNPIFHDDNASRRHLEKLLWPLGPHCARCGVTGDPDYEVTGEKYALWRLHSWGGRYHGSIVETTQTREHISKPKVQRQKRHSMAEQSSEPL